MIKLITHRQVTLAEVQRFYDDYGYDVGPLHSKDYTEVKITDPRAQIAWLVGLDWYLDGKGRLMDPRNGIHCSESLETLIGLRKSFPQGGWISNLYFGRLDERVFTVTLPAYAQDVMVVFSNSCEDCTQEPWLHEKDLYFGTKIKFQKEVWVDVTTRTEFPKLPRAYMIYVLSLHLEYAAVMEVLYSMTSEYFNICRNEMYALKATAHSYHKNVQKFLLLKTVAAERGFLLDTKTVPYNILALDSATNRIVECFTCEDANFIRLADFLMRREPKAES